MTEDKSRPNPFDPTSFRLSTEAQPGNAQKVNLRVPVRKPGKQQFVRANPDDEHQVVCGLLRLEDEDIPYLVSPHRAHLVEDDMKRVRLVTSIDRMGNLFLWPVPEAPIEGNDNSWNVSHRQVARLAETAWVRMKSNRTIGAYEPFEGHGEIPEPVWPDYRLEQLLEIAFGNGHVIDRSDHPAVKKLVGLA